MRVVLKQPQYQPRPVTEQVAVNGGVMDSTTLSEVPSIQQSLFQALRERLTDVTDNIVAGEQLLSHDQEAIVRLANKVR